MQEDFKTVFGRFYIGDRVSVCPGAFDDGDSSSDEEEEEEDGDDDDDEEDEKRGDVGKKKKKARDLPVKSFSKLSNFDDLLPYGLVSFSVLSKRRLTLALFCLSPKSFPVLFENIFVNPPPRLL